MDGGRPPPPTENPSKNIRKAEGDFQKGCSTSVELSFSLTIPVSPFHTLQLLSNDFSYSIAENYHRATLITNCMKTYNNG